MVVTAAKICGCRAVGVETVGVQVHKAWKLVESEGVGKLATIKQMDAFDVDLRSATVVFLYLLPKGEHPMCRIASLTCAFSHCPHARTLSLSLTCVQATARCLKNCAGSWHPARAWSLISSGMYVVTLLV